MAYFGQPLFIVLLLFFAGIYDVHTIRLARTWFPRLLIEVLILLLAA
jgi:hypothetical protein